MKPGISSNINGASRHAEEEVTREARREWTFVNRAWRTDILRGTLLGTFNLLPREIQSMILENLLAEAMTYKPTFCFRGYISQTLESWIDQLPYRSPSSRHRQLSHHEKNLRATVVRTRASSDLDAFCSIRQASRSLAQLLDIAFLSKRNFYFDKPALFEDFVLSPMVRNVNKAVHVRISVLVFPTHSDDRAEILAKMNSWNATIENLPSNLGSLAIELRFRKNIPQNWREYTTRLSNIMYKARDVAKTATMTIGVSYVRSRSNACQSAAMEGELQQLIKKNDQLTIEER